MKNKLTNEQTNTNKQTQTNKHKYTCYSLASKWLLEPVDEDQMLCCVYKNVLVRVYILGDNTQTILLSFLVCFLILTITNTTVVTSVTSLYTERRFSF